MKLGKTTFQMVGLTPLLDWNKKRVESTQLRFRCFRERSFPEPPCRAACGRNLTYIGLCFFSSEVVITRWTLSAIVSRRRSKLKAVQKAFATFWSFRRQRYPPHGVYVCLQRAGCFAVVKTALLESIYVPAALYFIPSRLSRKNWNFSGCDGPPIGPASPGRARVYAGGNESENKIWALLWRLPLVYFNIILIPVFFRGSRFTSPAESFFRFLFRRMTIGKQAAGDIYVTTAVTWRSLFIHSYIQRFGRSCIRAALFL